jgi:predicted double-glycine peptidase
MATAIVGKKFVKTTAVEVIDASGNQVLLQDVNKTHKQYSVPKDEFEEDYTLGEVVLNEYAVPMKTADDGMAVPNDENDTKEVKKTEETK